MPKPKRSISGLLKSERAKKFISYDLLEEGQSLANQHSEEQREIIKENESRKGASTDKDEKDEGTKKSVSKGIADGKVSMLKQSSADFGQEPVAAIATGQIYGALKQDPHQVVAKSATRDELDEVLLNKNCSDQLVSESATRHNYDSFFENELDLVVQLANAMQTHQENVQNTKDIIVADLATRQLHDSLPVHAIESLSVPDSVESHDVHEQVITDPPEQSEDPLIVVAKTATTSIVEEIESPPLLKAQVVAKVATSGDKKTAIESDSYRDQVVAKVATTMTSDIPTAPVDMVVATLATTGSTVGPVNIRPLCAEIGVDPSVESNRILSLPLFLTVRLQREEISSREFKILFAIINACSMSTDNYIALSATELQKATSIHRTHIFDALRKLADNNFISKEQQENAGKNRYRLHPSLFQNL